MTSSSSSPTNKTDMISPRISARPSSRIGRFRTVTIDRRIELLPLLVVVVVVGSLMAVKSSNNNGIFGSIRLPFIVLAFEFQHDDDVEACRRSVKQCTKDTTTWYECPITCSEHLGREGYMAEERDDPEQFFNLEVTTSKGTKYSIESNEGYITLFAVLPLLNGVAQYYYDAIEHISHVYKYTLVPIVYPFMTESATMALIRPAKDAKTILLMSGSSTSLSSSSIDNNNHADPNTSTLQYLLSRPIVAGNDQHVELDTDRPTIFLISHDGMYVERLIAPTMETIERRIKVYEQAMNFDLKEL